MNRQIHRIPRRAGFTLIELMIAVAIIGILASTAIAGYRNYQLRSKRSEAYINLKSLAGVQNAYFGEAGVYAGALPMPGPIPQSTGRTWTPAAEVAFAVIGWRPEGVVFFDYDVNVPGGPALAPCPCPECFTATAYGDTDGDSMVSVFMFVKPDRVGAFCPASVTGHAVPLDPMGQPMFDQPARNVLSDDF